MIRIDETLRPVDLLPGIEKLWSLSAEKIRSIERTCLPDSPSPVFTIDGKYTSQGWTEWTRGFRFGSMILQYDATGEEEFLTLGRDRTVGVMASHVTHFGVHDHGFVNVSTYGNLWRLMNESKIPEDPMERNFYELALKCSGAVQAKRWTPVSTGKGYIYSFNGPHSLFADTIRSLRSLAIAHLLGQKLHDENDVAISLLERLIDHAETTARFTVYHGQGRDAYDIRGRVAHESVFDTSDGNYRCPNTQQGFSPFSTWTRGLAWIICGYAEQLEFLQVLTDAQLDSLGGRDSIEEMMLRAARATGDFYLEYTPVCGIPYWDTAAPGLSKLGDYLDRPADPFNEHEPVDSSAAAIAAQGLLRLGRYLQHKGEAEAGRRYWQAGLTILKTLLDEPYSNTDPEHQGLILHSVYHRPRGWDHIPKNQKVPCGESCQWGDYHARELALYVQRIARNETYHTFFGPRK